MNRVWEVMTRLDETRLSHAECDAFRFDLPWPGHQLVREILTQLWDREFKRIPSNAAQQLRGSGGSFFGSLAIEEILNHVRLQAHCNQKGALDPCGVSHAAAFHRGDQQRPPGALAKP